MTYFLCALFTLLAITTLACESSIKPVAAQILKSSEVNGGVITNQQLLADVGDDLLDGDAKYVRMQSSAEISEDYRDVHQLYVHFKATEIAAVEGFVLLQVECAGTNQIVDVDVVQITNELDGCTARLRVRGKGVVGSKWLYSLKPEFVAHLSAQDSHAGTLLSTRDVQTGRVKERSTHELSEQWTDWHVPLPETVIRQIQAVASSELLLQQWMAKLAVKKPAGWLLAENGQSAEKIAAISKDVNRHGHVMWDIYVGKRSLFHGPRFRPDLKQPVLIQTADGQIANGEIWIMTEQDSVAATPP